VVLEIVLGGQPVRIRLCALALQSLAISDQRAVPLLHGGLGWDDSYFCDADFVPNQRRHLADAR